MLYEIITTIYSKFMRVRESLQGPYELPYIGFLFHACYHVEPTWR